MERNINKAMHVGSGGTWQWSLLVYKYPHAFVYLL